MPVDPVPWFVGGGAEHSPDVARLLAFNAANGNEGVLGPGDLAVGALPVPGSSVQVLPGAFNILNRTSGYANEMYMDRLPEADTVAIAATGSSGGRSDLVVMRVEDPTLAGSPWSPPADVTAGPYVFLRVIAGVPNTTTTVTELGLGYSAIPLARIDIPANTATITQAMITDLRFVANPRRKRILNAHALVGADGTNALDNTDSTNGQYWPPSVGRWFVPVPEWATRMQIVATLGSIQIPAGSNTNGRLWVQIGTNNDTNTYQTQRIGYDAASVPNNQRAVFVVIDDVAVHSVIRGTTASFGIRGYKVAGSGTGITSDELSSVAIDIEFVEVADATFQT